MDYREEYMRAARTSLEIERADWTRQILEADAARSRLAERCGRLESELASARLGAVRAGAEIARLCARLAVLEAEADANGCDDCDEDCDECGCEEGL